MSKKFCFWEQTFLGHPVVVVKTNEKHGNHSKPICISTNKALSVLSPQENITHSLLMLRYSVFSNNQWEHGDDDKWPITLKKSEVSSISVFTETGIITITTH